MYHFVYTPCSHSPVCTFTVKYRQSTSNTECKCMEAGLWLQGDFYTGIHVVLSRERKKGHNYYNLSRYYHTYALHTIVISSCRTPSTRKYSTAKDTFIYYQNDGKIVRETRHHGENSHGDPYKMNMTSMQRGIYN